MLKEFGNIDSFNFFVKRVEMFFAFPHTLSHMKKVVSLITLLAVCPLAFGQTVAYDMLNSLSFNLISFNNTAPVPFTSAGDGFQKYQGPAGEGNSLPFTLMDDSLATYTPDTLGIVSEFDPFVFFGAVDTINGDNDGIVTASWVFDISGANTGVLQFSASMAAMGDFEASDMLSFTGQIDDGSEFDLFTFAVDEEGEMEYFMDNGVSVILNDPMMVDGMNLSNSFTPYATTFAGMGSTLTVSLSAALDGGSEGFAMRNLTVAAVPEPSTYAAILGLLALGFVVYRRRR